MRRPASSFSQVYISALIPFRQLVGPKGPTAYTWWVCWFLWLRAVGCAPSSPCPPIDRRAITQDLSQIPVPKCDGVHLPLVFTFQEPMSVSDLVHARASVPEVQPGRTAITGSPTCPARFTRLFCQHGILSRPSLGHFRMHVTRKTGYCSLPALREGDIQYGNGRDYGRHRVPHAPVKNVVLTVATRTHQRYRATPRSPRWDLR